MGVERGVPAEDERVDGPVVLGKGRRRVDLLPEALGGEQKAASPGRDVVLPGVLLLDRAKAAAGDGVLDVEGLVGALPGAQGAGPALAERVFQVEAVVENVQIVAIVARPAGAVVAVGAFALEQVEADLMSLGQLVGEVGTGDTLKFFVQWCVLLPNGLGFLRR